MAKTTLVLAAALATGLIWAGSGEAQGAWPGTAPPVPGMAPPAAPGLRAAGGRWAIGRDGPGGPMGRGMGRRVDFHLGMADRLGLDEAQVVKLRAQKLDFEKAQVQRHAAVQTAEIELEAMRTAEPVATDKVEAKIREVFAHRAEVAVAAFAAQMEADKVLTAEQVAKAKRPGPWREQRMRLREESKPTGKR